MANGDDKNGKISKAGAAIVLTIVTTVAGGMFLGFKEVASMMETNQTACHTLVRETEESHSREVLAIEDRHKDSLLASQEMWNEQVRRAEGRYDACFDKLVGSLDTEDSE